MRTAKQRLADLRKKEKFATEVEEAAGALLNHLYESDCFYLLFSDDFGAILDYADRSLAPTFYNFPPFKKRVIQKARELAGIKEMDLVA